VSVISKILAGVMGAAILLAGSSASAAKYLVSFSGVMASGTDSGLFGAPGDLTGESFVATYLVDTSNPFHDSNPGVYDVISPAPVTLTIGGSTHVFPTVQILDSFAYAYVGDLDFHHFSVVEANPVSIWAVSNTAFSPWFQPTLEFGGNATISVSGGGSFTVQQCCCPVCGPNFQEIKSSGIFSTNTVTVTAVPEPAAWALMTTGFGLAGAALRRRRAIAA
jgi:hypothetical protein